MADNRTNTNSIGSASFESSSHAATDNTVKIQFFSHSPAPPLMTKKPHVTIHRKDYTAPAYWVNTVEMGFDLDPAVTRVATRITLQRNSASPNKDVELLGDGAKLVRKIKGKSKGSASNCFSEAITFRCCEY